MIRCSEPTKIFDNVYLVGREGAEVYAVTTPDGIILFDAGSPADVEPVVIPGLQKLGLDPAKIKIVIVSHGHADHFGGASYLQEHYGAHIYIGAADWDLLEHPPAGRGGEKQKKGPGPPLPKHDMVASPRVNRSSSETHRGRRRDSRTYGRVHGVHFSR